MRVFISFAIERAIINRVRIRLLYTYRVRFFVQTFAFQVTELGIPRPLLKLNRYDYDKRYGENSAYKIVMS